MHATHTVIFHRLVLQVGSYHHHHHHHNNHNNTNYYYYYYYYFYYYDYYYYHHHHYDCSPSFFRSTKPTAAKDYSYKANLLRQKGSPSR